MRHIRLSMVGAALIAVAAASSASAASTVVVQQGAMHGWAQTTQATGMQAFVTGPGTPPAGTGSLRMTTGAGTSTQGGKDWMYNASYDGTLLGDIRAMRYSTYQTPSPTAAPNLAVSLQFGVDADGDGHFDATLVYEPVYNGTVQTGQWQTWEADQGRWWSTRSLPAGTGALPNGMCAFDCYVSWQDIVAAYPHAKIISNGVPGAQLVAGQNSPGPPWQGFDGNVDAVTIDNTPNSSTVYDFEPGAPPPTCKLIFLKLGLLGGQPIVVCI